MTTSAHGRALIAAREGVRLEAYPDGVGVWTIGVGHTGRASPPIVTKGMKVTAAQVDMMLANDLAEFDKAVRSSVKPLLLQNQRGASEPIQEEVEWDESVVIHWLASSRRTRLCGSRTIVVPQIGVAFVTQAI